MGADICYAEEIIDKKVIASKRVENRAFSAFYCPEDNQINLDAWILLAKTTL
jgi:uncharacterized protein YlaI